MCLRYNTDSETGSASGVPGVGQTTEEACLPVTLPEREPHAEASVSPEEDGHSHIDPQSFPNSPRPGPPKTPSTLVVAVESEGVVRRSQRARKPPDRLEMNVTVIQVFVFLNCAKAPVYVQRYACYNTIVMFSEFVECC